MWRRNTRKQLRAIFDSLNYIVHIKKKDQDRPFVNTNVIIDKSIFLRHLSLSFTHFAVAVVWRILWMIVAGIHLVVRRIFTSTTVAELRISNICTVMFCRALTKAGEYSHVCLLSTTLRYFFWNSNGVLFSVSRHELVLTRAFGSYCYWFFFFFCSGRLRFTVPTPCVRYSSFKRLIIFS